MITRVYPPAFNTRTGPISVGRLSVAAAVAIEPFAIGLGEATVAACAIESGSVKGGPGAVVRVDAFGAALASLTTAVFGAGFFAETLLAVCFSAALILASAALASGACEDRGCCCKKPS